MLLKQVFRFLVLEILIQLPDRLYINQPTQETLAEVDALVKVPSGNEYHAAIKEFTTVNDKYVTDILETAEVPSSEVPDGSVVRRRWIQYKIPLTDFTEAVGGITDFRSISFLRMYLTGFTGPTVLRFATLDLVSGDWRTYTKNLQDPDIDPDGCCERYYLACDKI